MKKILYVDMDNVQEKKKNKENKNRWNCNICEHELVQIDYKTLKAIKELKPTINTLFKPGPRNQYRICPECDCYALGIEHGLAFPLTTREGKVVQIHDLIKY